MEILDFSPSRAAAVTDFGAQGAGVVALGHGAGEAHVYCLRVAPVGVIGPHRAGFGQLFLVVEGAGWVAGPDGLRHPVAAGQGAYFSRGEVHTKGSDGAAGMTAIMLQVAELAPAAEARGAEASAPPAR